MLIFLYEFLVEESLRLFHNVLKDEDAFRRRCIQKQLDEELAQQREEEKDIRELADDDVDDSPDLLTDRLTAGPSSAQPAPSTSATRFDDSDIEWAEIDDADVEMGDALDGSDWEFDS